MPRWILRSLPAWALLGCPFVSLAHAQANGEPDPYLIQNVRFAADEDAPRKHLLLRHGKIERVLEPDAATPPGTRMIDAQDWIALPTFFDSYTRAGLETPEPWKDQDRPKNERADVRVDMRIANRKGIQPAFNALELYRPEVDFRVPWRENGFGATLLAPSGQLLAGTSSLVVTREAAMRDTVVRPIAFAHGAFQASGPGYPSTLMGYIAQLRQYFHDVQHHTELDRRYQMGRPGPRPAWDDELEAGREMLAGTRRLVCEAETARDIERWIKLADEFGLQIAISGGRDAWRVADELALRQIPVFLTLNWGKEVDDPDAGEEEAADTQEEAADSQVESAEEGESAEAPEEEVAEEDTEFVLEYDEPLGVKRERRRLWEEGRDCALRLHEAGVTFAFGSSSDKPKELVGKVRTLVEEGLPLEVAMAALTTESATLLGVERHLGQVAAGFDASFALWTRHPLQDKKAKVVWIFVDGHPLEFEQKEEEELEGGPEAGLDVSGSWTITTESEEGDPNESTLVLEMEEDGTVSGTITLTNPMDQSKVDADVEGKVSGRTLVLDSAISFGQFEVELTIEAEVDGDDLSGEAKFKLPFNDDAMVRDLSGQRDPNEDDHGHPHQSHDTSCHHDDQEG